MSQLLLTHAELADLTDYELPAWQRKWLDDRGWRYELGRGGKIKVARAYFDARMTGGALPTQVASGPNFDALRKAV